MTFLFLFQHHSILGSVFADFYDQQLPSAQASALSQQVGQRKKCYFFLFFLHLCISRMTVVRAPPPHLSPLLTQLEQFNMMETAVSSDSLYNQTSTLNYSQALMMDLTGGHCNLPDSQQLAYSSHGNIPNIILTGA